MKNDNLLNAFDHIDERFVSEAMEYYEDEEVVKDRLAKRYKRLFLLASAACILLTLILLPSKTIRIDEYIYVPPFFGAPNLGSEISTIPEHDGSRGLRYTVNADGKSASFIGFGSCTESTVVIASYYGDLPVTEVYLGDYRAALENGDNAAGRITDYGSRYVRHLIISDSVEKVDMAVAEACISIDSIYFGASVNEILVRYFRINSIAELDVSPENEVFYVRDNCIIERATKTLIRGCKTSVIPSDGSVEIIGDRAFAGVYGIMQIEIPESVINIGRNAFMFCDNLKEVTLPPRLESLGRQVFLGCRNLKSVDLNGYTVLPEYAFSYATELVEIKGSENLTEIGENAFMCCHNLNITLSPKLQKIAKYAFLDARNPINFTGTIAEWHSIKKDRYWVAYLFKGYTINKIVCTDGNINLAPLPQK